MLRSKKELALLRKAGPQNRLYLALTNAQWEQDVSDDMPDITCMILKPNYNPEPEDCKVFICGGVLGIDRKTFKPLYCVPCMPDFHHFYRADNDAHVDWTAVARIDAKGITVKARFEKR